MGQPRNLLEETAQKVADRRGIRIEADGRWRYFPNARTVRELSATDIEHFLRRFYTPQELAMYRAIFKQEREITHMSQHVKRGSDGIAWNAGLPAKLDQALQHDFPAEFNMVMNKKSVRHVLALVARLMPDLLYQPKAPRMVVKA